MTMIRSLASALLLLAGLVAAGFAAVQAAEILDGAMIGEAPQSAMGTEPADEEAAEEAAVPSGLPPVEVTPGELASFAGTYRQVQEVQRRFAPRIAEAQGPQQAQLRDQANAEMRQAVEGGGLSVDRYNDLLLAYRGDPGFKSRVAAEIERLRQTP